MKGDYRGPLENQHLYVVFPENLFFRGAYQKLRAIHLFNSAASLHPLELFGFLLYGDARRSQLGLGLRSSGFPDLRRLFLNLRISGSPFPNLRMQIHRRRRRSSRTKTVFLEYKDACEQSLPALEAFFFRPTRQECRY